MNIDDFIEATDRDLEVDTSTRSGPGSLTPPGLSSPSRSVSGGSGNRRNNLLEGNKTHLQQRQFSPLNFSHQDHPLKSSRRPSVNMAAGPRRSATLNKRRSLIQPIVAPKTPDNHGIKSEPSTLVADRAHRQRSDSDASMRSTQAGTEPDISTLLQNLATKELELLDGKHRIEELKKQLNAEDALHQERLRELQELRDQVGIHFQRNNVSNMSPTGEKHRTKPKEPEQPTVSIDTASNPAGSNEQPQDERHSLWSKPLAILGQFDQIIQHEVERSLHWDQPASPAEDALRQEAPDEGGVSRSIWNFVNDVKSGLLGIDEEVENESRPVPKKDRTVRLTSGIKQFKTTNRTEANREANREANKLKFIGGGMSGDEDKQSSQGVEMKEL